MPKSRQRQIWTLQNPTESQIILFPLLNLALKSEVNARKAKSTKILHVPISREN